MINSFIDLIASYIPMFEYVLNFTIALAFVITVPCIVREVIRFV